MIDRRALTAANSKRWNAASVLPARVVLVDEVAKDLVSAKSRYEIVAASTGVPWAVIAVIHERESSQSWAASLAQGDRWNRVSTHVPAGRGPFKSWEDAAIDALANCAPYLARNKDWSIESTITRLESYNGLGYAARGAPSPYLWASTNQYRSGKYVRDGVYDAAAVDRQVGCVAMLLRMTLLDPTISTEWMKS